jgi:hypothetical protein
MSGYTHFAIYGLFNDAGSSYDYTASRVRRTTIEELKETWKEMTAA